MNTTMLEAILAFLGVVVSGMGLQWVLTRPKMKELALGSDAALRAELMARLKAQDERIEKMSCDLDEWQRRYYDLQTQNTQLQAQVSALTDEKARMQLEIDGLRTEVNALRMRKKL